MNAINHNEILRLKNYLDEVNFNRQYKIHQVLIDMFSLSRNVELEVFRHLLDTAYGGAMHSENIEQLCRMKDDHNNGNGWYPAAAVGHYATRASQVTVDLKQLLNNIENLVFDFIDANDHVLLDKMYELRSDACYELRNILARNILLNSR